VARSEASRLARTTYTSAVPKSFAQWQRLVERAVEAGGTAGVAARWTERATPVPDAARADCDDATGPPSC